MMFSWITEVKRGCGFRKEGGFYLKTAEGSQNGVIAAFSIIDPPVPTQRKPHRGPVLVDGQRILDREPEDTWVVGNSAKTVETKRANEVWTQVFGMPLVRRLDTGDCAGSKTAEEAYDKLLFMARWNKHVESAVRQLALEHYQDKPNMAGPYNRITAAMFAFARTQDAKELVKIGASAWEMFWTLPPSERAETETLARLLAALGFFKDALEMRSRAKTYSAP